MKYHLANQEVWSILFDAHIKLKSYLSLCALTPKAPILLHKSDLELLDH